MLQVPTWIRVLVALILISGIVIALPNVLPANVRSHLPSALQNTINLGLDLQGGSYLLLEVELEPVQKEKLESLKADIRSSLRKAHIGYQFLQTPDNSVGVRIIDPAQVDDAKTLLQALNPMSGGVLTVGARDYDMTFPGPGEVVFTPTSAYLDQTREQILAQSLEVVRRRIDAIGTREPTIERQGADRILVQVPGLSDPQRLIDLIGKTARLTFQLVDQSADAQQAQKGNVPIGDQLLPYEKEKTGPQPPPIVVQRRVIVAGDRLTDAAQSYDQQTGQPIVTFRFDSVGAKEFGDVTKEHTGELFAIILDNQVISAPRINEPILGGSGQISGGFTLQSATDLAMLLRTGALPAPIRVIDQRTVGASLGADSVQAGKYSTLAGLVLVALFMFARYGLFGIFADIALTLNIILLLALLTLLGATLTLPGIAGIVLTMGMAVDANVLIYERIREEQRNGRSILASIDTGFRLARATIFDANMTHLIAALILFELGSGPVRGFAVTLGLGIITSFFTAVMVTRLIVIIWLNLARPRQLTI